MAENLNLSVFSRAPFTKPDGTLTREALLAMAVVQRRTGDLAGVVYADTIANVPAGTIAATNVQDALNELDTEKANAAATTAALASKQPLDATLTALAALVTAADRLIYATGADTFALTTFTAFARSLLDDVDAAAMRSTLGLVIGTNVQAWDADLDTWAGKTAPTGTVVGTSDSQTLTNKTLTSPVINSPTGTMTLSSGSLGYAAGNGGVVVQSGTKSTNVTLSELSGEITMDGSALAAGTIVSFVATNTTVAATDVVIVNHVSGGTIGAYGIEAVAEAGQITFYVRNNTAGSLSEAPVIRFAVFKAATS